MTTRAIQQVPLAKPRSTTGIMLQRKAESGNDTNQKDSSNTNLFAQCPSTPVDDSKVKNWIHFALSATGGDVQRARVELHDMRERACCDVDMAAAEHYLFAREQVGTGPLPFEIDAVRMTAAILAQAAAKVVHVMPRTGRCPVTPFSTEQLKWEMKGVEDGASDAQKTRVKKSGTESSTLLPANAPEVTVSQRDAAPRMLQTKLTVNTPGDKYEQEADRVAEQVMRMPEPQVQRQCACGKRSTEGECSECKKKKQEATGSLQRVASSPGGGFSAPPIVNSVLSSSGSPLPTATRSLMESRFGQDFSHVRVHTDERAAESAAAVQARAYTVGNNIVFGRGEQPTRDQFLLAHELTHVIQQERIGQGVLHRQAAPTSPSVADKLESLAEELAKKQLGDLGNKPLGQASGFANPDCPTNFCQPFANKTSAAMDLAWAGPLILAGIAKKVNSRVVPLWASYLTGGSGPKNLSGDFGKDFTDSATTASITDFLLREMRKDIESHQAELLAGATMAVVDFTPRLSAALAAINTQADPRAMDFAFKTEIPGNIAGGIATDQLSFPIGAKPSRFNDERLADVRATLVLNPDGSVTVSPTIMFSVKDTVDLCPGNCGDPDEQVATVPLSRFEATGLVGDVPFTVQFSAPLSQLAPFVVASSPPPVPIHGTDIGTVTASALRIRSEPNTSATVVGSYPKGTVIKVLCQTTGTPIGGNSTWVQTDKGFVSDRYIQYIGPKTAPNC